MNAAIVYAKLAPYHDARLAHAARTGAAQGHGLEAIEVAGTQRDYRWRPLGDGRRAYRLHRLFPQRDYWDLAPQEVHTALHKTLDQVLPDVLVLPGWGFVESRAGLRWAARHGVPTVLISDSQPIDASRGGPAKIARRFLVRRFRAAFVAGAPHRRYVVDLGMDPERVSLGCDVVDNERFRAQHPPRASGSPPTLVSCIRLLPRKNVPFVLDVLATCADPWRWNIVGDGPERASIVRAIEERGLADRVVLKGHVPDAALIHELETADVYLQPSLSEPWGLAVNEAMAAGRPVLVSRACGCHEDLVREGENGYTFDPRDVRSLSGALDRMLAQRAKWPQMGSTSLQIVSRWGLDRFSAGLWQACAAAADAPTSPLRAARERLAALLLRR